MAAYTYAIHLLSIPQAGCLSVNPGFPVFEDCPMALAAKYIWLVVINQFSIRQPEVVAVMTVQTPPLLFSMLKDDIGMSQFEIPLFPVCGSEVVTLRTGKVF